MSAAVGRWCVNSVSARTSGSRNPLLMDVYNHQLDERLLNSHGPLSSVQEIKKGDVVEVGGWLGKGGREGGNRSQG